MKHHKGILYDDFILLSIEYRRIECKKICIFFKISKYMLLCKMVAMVILHQFLSAGHICQMWLNRRVIYDDLFTFDLSNEGIIGLIRRTEAMN